MDMRTTSTRALPMEFRGGSSSQIATNVPGVQICRTPLPLQAKMFDKLAVVRSLVSVDGATPDSLATTGFSENTNRTQHHPSFGTPSPSAKIRGGRQDIIPSSAWRGMAPGTEPGFLGIAHRPFTPGRSGYARTCASPGGVDMTRGDDRKALLHSFDDVRRDVDASGMMQGMDSFSRSGLSTWSPRVPCARR